MKNPTATTKVPAARKPTLAECFKLIDRICEDHPDYSTLEIVLTSADYNGYLQEGEMDGAVYYFTGMFDLKLKLTDMLNSIPETVDIAGGAYDAEIKEDGITVGCTHVSYNELQAVLNAASKFHTFSLDKSK